MTIGEPVVAVACGDTLGESATWSAREAALYWVDIRGPTLHRFDPLAGEHRHWSLPELCGGVVPMATGVLLALRHDLVHFNTATGWITPLCTVEPAALGNRLNEAKCDRRGRLWVGSMRDFAAAITGSLYAVDATLTPRRVIGGITVPNSLGWSPDGGTMYFADSREGVVRAYDYDESCGSLGERRSLVGADVLPGVPDGCTVDAEGHVWSTRVGAGRVVRIAPDGTVSASVELPATQPTSCAVGGPGLRTLYVTTARQGLDADELRRQPYAGHLFAIHVDVPGLPDAEFAATATAAGRCRRQNQPEAMIGRG